jgi:hypothetical protein
MNDFSEAIGTIFGVILLLIVLCVLLTLPVMWLWNWLMPLIFGLIKITFWQALGLSLLCACLFGGKTIRSKE